MISNRRDLERQNAPCTSPQSENDSFFRRMCEFVANSDSSEDHSRQATGDYNLSIRLGQGRLVRNKVVGVIPKQRPKSRSLMQRDNPLVGGWEHLKDHPEFRSDRDTNSRFDWASRTMGYLQRCSK